MRKLIPLLSLLWGLSFKAAEAYITRDAIVVTVDMRTPLSRVSYTGTNRALKVLAMRDRRLICADVASAYSKSHFSTVDANTQQGFRHDWAKPENSWTPESQILRYLAASKLAYLANHCFLYRPGDDSWVLDICIGQSVEVLSHKYGSRDLTALMQYTYNSSADRVYANGALAQEYENEASSLTISFECDLKHRTNVRTADSESAVIDGLSDASTTVKYDVSRNDETEGISHLTQQIENSKLESTVLLNAENPADSTGAAEMRQVLFYATGADDVDDASGASEENLVNFAATLDALNATSAATSIQAPQNIFAHVLETLSRELFGSGIAGKNDSESLFYRGSNQRSMEFESLPQQKTVPQRLQFTGPAFCDWRIFDTPIEKSQNMDPEIDAFLLLGDLEGRCFNYTMESGEWSYEFCYPESLIQYRTTDSDVVDEAFAGTLPQGTYPQQKEQFFPRRMNSFFETEDEETIAYAWPPPPNLLFPELRTTQMESARNEQRPGSPLLFPSLPISLVEAPAGAHLADMEVTSDPAGARNILGRKRRALKLELPRGSVCQEKSSAVAPKFRSATVYFLCPDDFLVHPEPRLVNVREHNLCEYEAVVHTSLVCAHPAMLPDRHPATETVICHPETAADAAVQTPEIPFFSSHRPHRRIRSSLRPAARKNLAESLRNRLSASGQRLPDSIELERCRFNYVLFRQRILMGDCSDPSLPCGTYAMGEYIRDADVALYKIGDVLWHRRLGIKSVVVGWDPACRGTDSWRNAFVVRYPAVDLEQPFYLLMLDAAHFKASENTIPLEDEISRFLAENGPGDVDDLSEFSLHVPTLIYTPEEFLQLSAKPETFWNPSLQEYFGDFSEKWQRFLVRTIPEAFRSSQIAAFRTDSLVRYYWSDIESYAAEQEIQLLPEMAAFYDVSASGTGLSSSDICIAPVSPTLDFTKRVILELFA